MDTIILAASACIALCEMGFAVFKYSKESIRRRRSETIAVYNTIFKETYTLREIFYNTTNKELFASKEIHNDPQIYKSVMNHLTVLESFAKGLEYEVYDFKTFVSLTPNELFEILNSLKQFVYDERKAKSYDLLFNDFIYLTDVMSICIQKKLRGEKISVKYSKMKVGK